MMRVKMNIIGKNVLTNLPYFILLLLVYGRNTILFFEIVIFITLTIVFEAKYNIKKNNKTVYVKNCLEVLDQYLRIGFSPNRAYEKMLITQETNHMMFKNAIIDTSHHGDKILEFLKENFTFNYRVFKKQTYIILKEIESYESMRIIYRKNL